MKECSENLTIYISCIVKKSGDRFLVKVKPVQIKGVRIFVEHMIETLPESKVR